MPEKIGGWLNGWPIPPYTSCSSAWIISARANVMIRLTSGSLSYSRRMSNRSTTMPTRPTRIGARITAGQPKCRNRVSAKYAPSAKKLPCAKFTMPSRPKMIDSPIAISTYRPPSTSPAATCDKRTSSTARRPKTSSGHVAAVVGRRTEHLVKLRRVLRDRALDVEVVPLVRDLLLHLNDQVLQQHLVIALAPVVRAAGGAALPGFQTLDDRVGFRRLHCIDRFEQRLRGDPAHPRLVGRRLAEFLQVRRGERLFLRRVGGVVVPPQRGEQPGCRLRPDRPYVGVADGDLADRDLALHADLVPLLQEGGKIAGRHAAQNNIRLRLADLQDERAVVRRVERYTVV